MKVSVRQSLQLWAPVAGWMAVIFVVSAQSDLPGSNIRWLSILLSIMGHVTEYAVLALLMTRALGPLRARSPRRVVIIVLVFCAAYAAGDEYHQSLVAGRDATVIDILLDLAGTGLGYRFARRLTASRESVD